MDRMGHLPSKNLIDEGMLVIPTSKGSFDAFRAWTHSDTFPRHGRIDYIDGLIYAELDEDNPFVIPPGIIDFETFREWTLSDGFPKRGRIDYIV